MIHLCAQILILTPEAPVEEHAASILESQSHNL